ncbi:helix-turn-helix domain-containing protein [Roseobacter weihaiensis]|uniref:helix-turn-helix domain-containing protein n=1 Tax=Roseobacter weihaiensis TaxID=2763262 RepID=UPI001D0A22BC|nr:helix-turn-helix domain-containing protein [Roseobacter sp. H9]
MTDNDSAQPTVEAHAMQIDMAGRTLADVIKDVEARYLGHVLTEAGGNKRKAADLAGLAPDTFRKKLSLYSIRAVFSVG